MQKNTLRFDLSDRLIHFFRQIDFDSNNAPFIPEHIGFNNIYELGGSDGSILPALFMLRCAIRQGKLWATWSYRNNIRTIYGNAPAVCFTEMPLAAFLESGEFRERRGEAMSQFALIFNKNDLFKLGANPVIYGLDNRKESIPSGKNGAERIMPPDLLPIREQYRYVTYNPCGERPIDWSHEREWRWAYRDNYMNENDITEYHEMSGLNLNDPTLGGIGVVVQTEEQAKKILHDILSLVDRNIILQSHYDFILCACKLPNSSILREPREVSNIINNSLISLEPYFSISVSDAEFLENRFSEIVTSIENSYSEIEYGEFGGAWLWLLDNTHTLTRALHCCERIIISNEGRYLVRLPEFSDSRSLSQREEMIENLSKIIAQEFKIECCYFSVLNSDNVDDVPFYCGSHSDNGMFYNTNW